MSRTTATLAVSAETYNEIAEALERAGYDHVFVRDNKHGIRIDMDGISLAVSPGKSEVTTSFFKAPV